MAPELHQIGPGREDPQGKHQEMLGHNLTTNPTTALPVIWRKLKPELLLGEQRAWDLVWARPVHQSVERQPEGHTSGVTHIWGLLYAPWDEDIFTLPLHLVLFWGSIFFFFFSPCHSPKYQYLLDGSF